MTSSNLRIGMVSVDSPPHIGGMGRHVGSLMEGLKRIGQDIVLYDRTKRPLFYRLGRNVGFSLGLSGALRSWVATQHIDLLHVHAGPGGVFLPSPPIPMIVTANHTYAEQCTLRGQGWKRIFLSPESRTYRSASFIASISPDTTESIYWDYSIDQKRVRTMGCGFDTEPWQRSGLAYEDRRGCVFVGRKDRRKGFDLLLSAWNIIHRTHPEEILSIVGIEGNDQDGLRFLGRLPDPDLRALVGRSKVLLMPSRLEGFGLSAAEAIAAGTPVIATDVAGLRSTVERGVSGIHTSLDPTAIAAATISVFTDELLWKRLHEGCLREQARFSFLHEAQAYRDLYNEVYSSSACATHAPSHCS